MCIFLGLIIRCHILYLIYEKKNLIDLDIYSNSCRL